MGAIQQVLFDVTGAAAATWRTVFDSTTYFGGSGGWNGYTLRHVIPASVLAGAATLCRITMHPATSAGYVIDKCYVQEAAGGSPTPDVYDFATTPVQVLFSGAAGLTLAADQTVLSDEATISIAGTSAIVISVHFSNTSAINLTTVPAGHNAYYLLGDNAAAVNATSGYTSTGGWAINKLELYG